MSMTKMNAKLAFLFLGFSILYILPMIDFANLQLAIPRGDDYPFHFARIFSMTQQLKHFEFSGIGIFGSHELLYGANLFYPTLTSVLPISLLTILFNSTLTGLAVYVVLLNFLTFLIAFMCGNYVIGHTMVWVKDVKIRALSPFIFSVLFVFSHYRLVCFFERIALGEFVAMSFYPLVFAGFYSIIMDNGKKKHWLILGMALLAYTHLLSLFLVASVLLLLLLVCAFKGLLNKKVLLNFIGSGLLAGGLSAASLGPIFQELVTFKIRSVSSHDLQSEAYSFSQTIFTSIINQLGYMSLGIILLIILIFGGGIYLLGRSSVIQKYPVLKWTFILTLLFAFSLTTLFPWNLVQETPLKIMQFPFRLMPFIAIFGYFFGSVLIGELICRKFVKRRKIVMAGGVLLVLFSALTVESFIFRQDRGSLFTSKEDIVQSKRYVESVNKDYFPADLTKEQTESISNKTGFVNHQPVPMTYSAAAGTVDFPLALTAAENQIDLPIIAYTGMTVKDQAGMKMDTARSERGTLLLHLPKGEYELSVFFQQTLFMRICTVISSALALTYLFFIGTKKFKRNNSD